MVKIDPWPNPLFYLNGSLFKMILNKIRCLQLQLFVHLWESWIGQRPKTTDFGQVWTNLQKEKKIIYLQHVKSFLPSSIMNILTSQVIFLEQCHEERYPGLWCQVMSWRVDISSCCSRAMSWKMTSWVMVLSNVLKGSHLRSLLLSNATNGDILDWIAK